MSTTFTRRDLVKVAGAGVLGAFATTLESSAQTNDKTDATFDAARQFPKGFFWGTATASYQIEGAWNTISSGSWAGSPSSGCIAWTLPRRRARPSSAPPGSRGGEAQCGRVTLDTEVVIRGVSGMSTTPVPLRRRGEE